MATIFYCFAKTSEFVAPTEEKLRLYGGTLENGMFKLNNGRTAKSPTGACKACLTRDGLTNEWQGPNHVYVTQDGANWTKWNNLTNH